MTTSLRLQSNDSACQLKNSESYFWLPGVVSQLSSSYTTPGNEILHPGTHTGASSVSGTVHGYFHKPMARVRSTERKMVEHTKTLQNQDSQCKEEFKSSLERRKKGFLLPGSRRRREGRDEQQSWPLGFLDQIQGV